MRVENADEQQLIVANEELSTLEDVARVMPKAQYFNVAFNNLNSLCGLEQMQELRSLDISHNNVESLQEIATLSKLLVLKCSSNQITDVSWIAGLDCLEELWLRDNRIENAQVAHLQQLTALQTLIIHPNPCTERDDYVLVILKVLPWLQRVDTVVVTEALRGEARHAEERVTLDSGVTDCSLFSLSGRSEDARSNEDLSGERAATPPVPPLPTSSKPEKPKKQQMTAEDFMRAFPVQDFIPLDSNGEAAVVPDNQFTVPENEITELKPVDSVIFTAIETKENQTERSPYREKMLDKGNMLQNDNGDQKNQALLKTKAEGQSGGISALLGSVLTLPTFDKDSFLTKKKSHPQVPGNTKSKQRVKSNPVILPDTAIPFHQNEEYTVAYPNSTVTAIQVRCDGSTIARWPSGSVAISIDFETAGFRVYAAHKDGQLALSFDPAGVGFLNAYPSGKTLLSTTSDGNGVLFDAGTGAILRQWDAQGRLRDGACQPADVLGDEPDGSLLCRLSDHLVVRVQLVPAQQTGPEPTNGVEQDAPLHRISLHIYFAGTPNVRHVFVNSANRAEPCNMKACEYALGKVSSKEGVTRTVKAKPPPMEHTDLLSSIRAAVAGL